MGAVRLNQPIVGMTAAKDGKGYTTDLNRAHVYTREEAYKQHTMRPSDRPWPVEYIRSISRPTVDMQHAKIRA